MPMRLLRAFFARRSEVLWIGRKRQTAGARRKDINFSIAEKSMVQAVDRVDRLCCIRSPKMPKSSQSKERTFALGKANVNPRAKQDEQQVHNIDPARQRAMLPDQPLEQGEDQALQLSFDLDVKSCCSPRALTPEPQEPGGEQQQQLALTAAGPTESDSVEETQRYTKFDNLDCCSSSLVDGFFLIIDICT